MNIEVGSSVRSTWVCILLSSQPSPSDLVLHTHLICRCTPEALVTLAWAPDCDTSISEMAANQTTQGCPRMMLAVFLQCLTGSLSWLLILPSSSSAIMLIIVALLILRAPQLSKRGKRQHKSPVS
jgi:hypothetical protein